MEKNEYSFVIYIQFHFYCPFHSMLPILEWIFNCLYFSSLVVCCFLFSSFDSFQNCRSIVLCMKHTVQCTTSHDKLLLSSDSHFLAENHNPNYCFLSRQSKAKPESNGTQHNTGTDTTVVLWITYKFVYTQSKNKNVIFIFPVESSFSTIGRNLKEMVGKMERARVKKMVDLVS